MRLLSLVLVLATATPAAADGDPELLAAPDLQAETGVRVRAGMAALDDVNGSERKAQAALLTAIRGSYAVRDDLEVSLAVSTAALYYTNRDGIVGSSFDGGLGLPAFGVEWSRPVAARLRVGAGALGAIGTRTPDMYEDPYPADVAAGAFFIDPEVVWTRAHMGLVHGGVVWSDGRTTVLGDLGVQGYVGGALPEGVSILRLTAGAATRLGGAWTASLETVLESDVHHEGLADDTDLVPAVTAGVRRQGNWDLGFGVTRAWTFAATGQGEAQVAFLVDVARRY